MSSGWCRFVGGAGHGDAHIALAGGVNEGVTDFMLSASVLRRGGSRHAITERLLRPPTTGPARGRTALEPSADAPTLIFSTDVSAALEYADKHQGELVRVWTDGSSFHLQPWCPQLATDRREEEARWAGHVGIHATVVIGREPKPQHLCLRCCRRLAQRLDALNR